MRRSASRKKLEIVATLPPLHPGEVLREEFLLPMNLSAYIVAKACGVPRTRIERIAREEMGISADTALRLGRFFGIDRSLGQSADPSRSCNGWKGDRKGARAHSRAPAEGSVIGRNRKIGSAPVSRPARPWPFAQPAVRTASGPARARLRLGRVRSRRDCSALIETATGCSLRHVLCLVAPHAARVQHLA